MQTSENKTTYSGIELLKNMIPGIPEKTNPGIYIIKDGFGKAYVGATDDVKLGLKSHLTKLKTKKGVFKEIKTTDVDYGFIRCSTIWDAENKVKELLAQQTQQKNNSIKIIRL